MKRNNKIIIGSVAAAMLLSVALIAPPTMAANSAQVNGMVQAIANKFNLKPSEVQSVVDQYRASQQTKKQQNFQTALDKAVTAGKLTSAQRDLILAEETQVQARLTQIKAMTSQADRTTALKQLRTDVSDWAKQNGIDLKWVAISALKTSTLNAK